MPPIIALVKEKYIQMIMDFSARGIDAYLPDANDVIVSSPQNLAEVADTSAIKLTVVDLNGLRYREKLFHTELAEILKPDF